jgi:hypothetical protein
VVVHNFHIHGTYIAPPETYAPLLIDADTVLAFPVAFQGFELVAWRGPQIAQHRRPTQLLKLPECCSLNVDTARHAISFKQALCISAFE